MARKHQTDQPAHQPAHQPEDRKAAPPARAPDRDKAKNPDQKPQEAPAQPLSGKSLSVQKTFGAPHPAQPGEPALAAAPASNDELKQAVAEGTQRDASPQRLASFGSLAGYLVEQGNLHVERANPNPSRSSEDTDEQHKAARNEPQAKEPVWVRQDAFHTMIVPFEPGKIERKEVVDLSHVEPLHLHPHFKRGIRLCDKDGNLKPGYNEVLGAYVPDASPEDVAQAQAAAEPADRTPIFARQDKWEHGLHVPFEPYQLEQYKKEKKVYNLSHVPRHEVLLHVKRGLILCDDAGKPV